MTQTNPSIYWRIALAFSIGLMAVLAHAQSLEIIDLRHRTAQELIPALQPLVAPGGSVSGQEYKLFVRTTGANLAELKRVIAQLDKAPRQLLVSVRNATRQQLERQGIDVSGQLSTDRARVEVSGSDASSQRQNDGVASIAVLEGNAAFINNGSSVPIVTAVAGGGGRRPWAGGQLEYRNLANGFLVTPRIGGDSVILDISQRAESVRNGVVDTQQLETQVSGKLGEWISLGGINSSSTSSRSGIGSRQYSTGSDERTVWVKVEMQ